MIDLKKDILIIILLLLNGCSHTPNVSVSRDKKLSSNRNAFCDPDSSKPFIIRYEEGKGFVAIDRDGKRLFTVFPFDNGPDYPSEGLFRIVEDNKIGFANLRGEVVIQPRFSAVRPFHGGLAAFCDNCITVSYGEYHAWENGQWGFIDTSGNIIIPAQYDKIIHDFGEVYASVEKDGSQINIDKKGNQIRKEDMNYREWVRLLGEVTSLIQKTILNDQATVALKWSGNDKTFTFPIKSTTALIVQLQMKDSNKLLAKYTIIPWQNFSMNNETEKSIEMGTIENLLTVTEYAVIYTSLPASNLSTVGKEFIESFSNAFKKVLDYENNQTAVEKDDLDIPPGIQIISGHVFKHYIDLQVAIPGSNLPEHTRWGKVSTNKMVYLSLVPDHGQVKSSWIQPAKSHFDPYYTSVEAELLALFAGAVEKSMNNPENRHQVFNETKSRMRNLFNAANSYVNFLYHEYETKLFRWLLLQAEEAEQPDIENMFPDYEPKRTPDTVMDFRPELAEEIYCLPAATTENLPELLQLFIDYQKRADNNPGHWVDGNVILGAGPREYQPSPEELLTAEIGDRLQSILCSAPVKRIQNLLKKEKIQFNNIEYTRYTFTHVDVMGSGRFFYVDTIEQKRLHLREHHPNQ